MLPDIIYEQCPIQKVICDALRDLAPHIPFKKREKHPRRSVTSNVKHPATLLKVTLLHACFTFYKFEKWYQIAQIATYI